MKPTKKLKQHGLSVGDEYRVPQRNWGNRIRIAAIDTLADSLENDVSKPC